MNKKNIIIVLTVLALFSARSLSAQGYGGYPGEFLRYGIGGRALGMGRAFVAVANDASGILWNPAGIVGAQYSEFNSMYSNLYYDSQFANAGIILPRIFNLKDPVGKYLLGKNSSIGFAWVGLASASYEQRTVTGVKLGDFNIGENAFLLSWAHENTGLWGIFRYGTTIKFVSQNFSGIQEEVYREIQSHTRSWSGGIDIGMTFQPIHAPVFKVFALRYLLPLRFGINLQNIIQPGWRIHSNDSDRFPRVLRMGLSYRFIMKDWIPRSWTGVRKFFEGTEILFAYDREYYEAIPAGNYMGFEGMIPIKDNSFVFYPRFGFNNRSEGPSFGFGLQVPFTNKASVRIDYVYGSHPYLPEDNRFFISLKFGKQKGSKYFNNRAKLEKGNDPVERNNLFRVLALYPNSDIDAAVRDLADRVDTLRARRYYDLTGGLGRAELLFREAKKLLVKGDGHGARKKANEAAEEYLPIFNEENNTLTDNQLMDFSECYIITEKMNDALGILQEVDKVSLRHYYLDGVCRKYNGQWDKAIEVFRKAAKQFESEQDRNSMVRLSILALGESLLKKKQYESSLKALELLQKKTYINKLSPEYPRYPIYNDLYIVDEAQFLTGVCYLSLGDYERGVTEIMKTQRYYPNLDYGVYVGMHSTELIQALMANDKERLNSITSEFTNDYFKYLR